MGRDDEQDEQPRRRSTDRDKPSAWQDPRTWMQAISVLLGICALIGGYVGAQLTNVNNALVILREDKAAKTEQIQRLQHDVDDAKKTEQQHHDAQEQINSVLKDRLGKLEVWKDDQPKR